MDPNQTEPEPEASTSVVLKEPSQVVSVYSLGGSGGFETLPDEIMLKILKKLDLKALCRCAQVNRYFRLRAKDPLLWSRIDIGLRYLQNMGPGLYIDINRKFGRGKAASGFFKMMMNYCKCLRHLSLTFTSELEGISREDLFKFVQTCCGQLTYLNVSYNQTIDNEILAQIAFNSLGLKELNLSNCGQIRSNGFQCLENLQCLESLSLVGTSIRVATLLSLLPNFRRLRSFRMEISESMKNFESVAIQMSICCPNIEVIFWEFSLPLSANTWEALEQCRHLRKITLKNYSDGPLFNGDVPRTFFQNSDSLRTFVYTVSSGIYDDLSPMLYNQLETLILVSENVAPGFLLRLLRQSPQLKMLTLRCCSQITNAHVLHYRRLYPHITINSESQNKDMYTN